MILSCKLHGSSKTKKPFGHRLRHPKGSHSQIKLPFIGSQQSRSYPATIWMSTIEPIELSALTVGQSIVRQIRRLRGCSALDWIALGADELPQPWIRYGAIRAHCQAGDGATQGVDSGDRQQQMRFVLRERADSTKGESIQAGAGRAEGGIGDERAKYPQCGCSCGRPEIDVHGALRLSDSVESATRRLKFCPGRKTTCRHGVSLTSYIDPILIFL
jgi:hypothetical protein